MNVCYYSMRNGDLSTYTYTTICSSYTSVILKCCPFRIFRGAIAYLQSNLTDIYSVYEPEPEQTTTQNWARLQTDLFSQLHQANETIFVRSRNQANHRAIVNLLFPYKKLRNYPTMNERRKRVKRRERMMTAFYIDLTHRHITCSFLIDSTKSIAQTATLADWNLGNRAWKTYRKWECKILLCMNVCIVRSIR